MNKRLTTDMADANGLKKSYKSYRIFQHQENGGRFLQRAMHNGQYWAFKVQVWIVLDVSLFFFQSARTARAMLRPLDNLHTVHICVPTCTLNSTQEPKHNICI